jgi:CheY-like chemotaxis protein
LKINISSQQSATVCGCEMTDKQTIMIIDDINENTLILTKLLQDEYETIFSHSAKNAINILTYHEIDLILLNLKVQWPGGKEYFKNLKTEAEIYQIPIYSFADLFQQDPTIP